MWRLLGTYRGLPMVLARSLSMLPLGIADRARKQGTRLSTALSARALGAEKRNRLREMIANADQIVAVCQWLYDVLAANGVPAEKLHMCRQGISPAFLNAVQVAATDRSRCSPALKLLYLGRWDPVKGIDVVVRAIHSIDSDVSLTIRAVAKSAHERAYEERVHALAEDDPRIAFEGPIGRSEIPDILAQFDVLVVPSTWLETGPLVVLEAQAAGLFILGSRLGGIAELVSTGGGGTLVEPGNVQAWAEAIEGLSELHGTSGMPRQARTVRTMSLVAAEMADLYHSL